MSFHEEFRRDDHPEGSSDRGFGLVLAAFCSIMAARDGWLSRTFSLAWIAVALLFLGCAFIFPRALAPLNWAWARAGLLLLAVVGPIMLGFLFAVCFVPMGLLARFMGRDFLQLKRQETAQTYWIRRHSSAAAEAMRKQF
jgi:hypothetical protein